MKERIPYYIEAKGEPSADEDAEVPGIYLVMVDADVPDEDRPSAALDLFHENQAVDMLDDFDFTVYDRSGAIAPEKFAASGYSFNGRGSFEGPVDELPKPSALAPGIA